MTPPSLPIRVERPVVVRWAVLILWMALALGIVHTFLLRPWNPPQPTVSEARALALLPAGAMRAVILFISVLKWVLYGWLIYGVSRGKNWARITRLVFFAVGVAVAVSPLLHSPLLRSVRSNPFSGALGIFQHLLVAVALVMLFTRAAKPWFEPSPSLAASAMI